MPKSPWDYAETGNEHSHQTALFMWAGMCRSNGLKAASDPKSYTEKGYVLKHYAFANDLWPQLKWLHAVANAGAGFGRVAEGVRAGVFDIFLPVPMIDWVMQEALNGLYIELKRPQSKGKKEGKPSDKQLEFQKEIREAGYMAEICYSWEEARDVILKYLNK